MNKHSFRKQTIASKLKGMSLCGYGLYLDENGNPCERTRHEYPYSYDPYVVYRNGDNKDITGTMYDDRMRQWDWDKFEKCCQEVWGNKGQIFSSRKGPEIERFLRLYTDDRNLKLILVMEGANHSNGFPYWIFMYNSETNK